MVEAVQPIPTVPAPPPEAPLIPARERPLGVTILALLGALGGIALLLGGLAMLVASPFAAMFAPFPFIAGMALAVAAVFVLAFGAACLVAAAGMWRGAPWAWTLTLILVLLGVIGNLFALPQGIVGLAVDLFLLWYITREGVERWFSKVGAWPTRQVDGVLHAVTQR